MVAQDKNKYNTPKYRLVVREEGGRELRGKGRLFDAAGLVLVNELYRGQRRGLTVLLSL